jgi:hypothetical protein
VLAILGVILAFVLPGCLLARILRVRLGPVAGLLLSVMLLVQLVFWMGLAGAALNLHTVGAALLTANLLIGFFFWRRPARSRLSREFSPLARLTFAICAGIGLLVLVRLVLAPLTGADTYWRWEFLATQILTQQSFAFYPPFDAADFAHYFYPEGVPPMVGFSYFWLYACFGGVAKSATCLLVFAQWAAILATAWALTRRFGSEKAAALAVAILLSCPIVFWAVAIGQETGWTTLSMLAMLFFLSNEGPRRRQHVAMAAVAAAIGALSREYGCYISICGVLTLLWQRNWRDILLFGVVVAALAAPWYLRTWTITGNPIYSLGLGDLFPRNLMYHTDMERLAQTMGFQAAPGAMALFFLVAYAQYATLPLAGLAGAVALLRRQGFLLICAALGTLIWLMSVRYTDVLSNSERVMAPVFALLAVAAALWFDSGRKGILAVLFLLLGAFANFALLDAGRAQLVQWPVLLGATLAAGALGLFLDLRAPRGLVRSLVMAIVLLALARSLLYVAAFPTRHLKDGIDLAKRHHSAPREVNVRAFLQWNPLPPGTRILATTTYARPTFANTAYEIVSPFSPEMLFLLESENPAVVNAGFDERGIGAILVLENPSVCRVPGICSKPAEGWRLVFDHWPNRLYVRDKARIPPRTAPARTSP